MRFPPVAVAVESPCRAISHPNCREDYRVNSTSDTSTPRHRLGSSASL